MHRLDLGLYSHPKEFWRNGVRNHANSEGNIPSTGASEEVRTLDAASCRTASPTQDRLSYSGPLQTKSTSAGDFNILYILPHCVQQLQKYFFCSNLYFSLLIDICATYVTNKHTLKVNSKRVQSTHSDPFSNHTSTQYP